jgi:ATP-dependent Clp protease ATP-binding subunit ClpB
METRIGRALIGGEVFDGATIEVEMVDGGIVVTYENHDSSAGDD